MDDKLFDTQPLIFGKPVASSRTGKPLSARGLAQRASQRRRLGSMHAKHGHGPEGRTCKDCVSLTRIRFAGTYLKCEQYGDSRSDASDWRAKWPACGAFTEASRV